MLQCAAMCARNESCISASYHEVEGSCSLSTYRVNMDDDQQVITDAPAWTTILKTGCMVGWTDLEDSCYLFYGESEMNFTEAKKFCAEKGGKLAEPQTMERSDILSNYLIKQNHTGAMGTCWIGLWDVNGDGQFVWASNGASPAYNVWAPQHPYPPSVDTRVAYDLTKEFKWVDYSCSCEFHVICEM